MNGFQLFRVWCGFTAFAAVATVFSILYFDGPVANYSKRDVHLTGLVASSPSSLLIGAALAVIVAMVGLCCILTGRFPKWAEAVSLSILTAGLSLGLTALFFKPLFARPDPQIFVYRLRDNFGWHSQDLVFSAFPSTHAALFAAGLSVLGLYFPRARIPCILCLSAIDVLLVIGGWHFISDVLAGNMLGFTIGALGYRTAILFRTPPRI